MNLIEIGNFIAECRKEKGLTQQNLASKLFVSEKTVSKWECGKGFPDTSIMLDLCEILQISANELLSGRRLEKENYKKMAEENLLKLKSSQEKNFKHMLTLEIFIGVFSTLAFLLLTLSASFFVTNLAWKIVLYAFGVTLFVSGMFFCLSIERNSGFYECSCCHHKYIPTYGAIVWAMHSGRTRFMKCPKCGRRSWCRKVSK